MNQTLFDEIINLIKEGSESTPENVDYFYCKKENDWWGHDKPIRCGSFKIYRQQFNGEKTESSIGNDNNIEDSPQRRETIKWYWVAADTGDAIGQYNLALSYDLGDGIEQDPAEAVRLYLLAAEQGNPKAQNNLGVLYQIGEGVDQDSDNAAGLFRFPAYEGYPESLFNLGVLYMNGDGVEKDCEEAARLYRMAAERGLSVAKVNLGVCFALGKGVPKDYSKALEIFSFAAKDGDSVAQYGLTFLYRNGFGVTKDLEESIKHCRSSAEQGNVDAQRELGRFYLKGEGVQQSSTEAVVWYKQAAEHGDSVSEAALGFLIETGNDYSKNTSEAIKWYERAAEHGNSRAQVRLGEMYEEGCNIGQDIDEAIKWYTMAAINDEPSAQYKMGSLYFQGKGVEKDLDEAANWFRLAADNNYANARRVLERFDSLNNEDGTQDEVKEDYSDRIRFDGVYQAKETEHKWHYLRFYENGVAVSATASASDHAEIVRNLSPETAYASVGDYRIDKNYLSASMFFLNKTSNTECRFDYYGTIIDKNHLNLDFYSNETGVFCNNLKFELCSPNIIEKPIKPKPHKGSTGEELSPFLKFVIVAVFFAVLGIVASVSQWSTNNHKTTINNESKTNSAAESQTSIFEEKNTEENKDTSTINDNEKSEDKSKEDVEVAKITVPSFIGMTLDETLLEASKMGLKISKMGTEYSDVYEEGEVIEQTISEGSLVEKDETIGVILSKGKEKVEEPVWVWFYSNTNSKDTEHIYGEEITIPNDIFSRQDYVFKGWSESNGGGVKYRGGETISPATDLDLYAVWELDENSVRKKIDIRAYNSDVSNYNGELYYENGSQTVRFYILKNNSSVKVDVFLEASLLDSSGNVKDTITNVCYGLDPGAESFLQVASLLDDVSDVPITINVQESKSTFSYGDIKWEKVSDQNGETTSRITNIGKRELTVYILYVFYNEDGQYIYTYNTSLGNVRSGEEKSFNIPILFMDRVRSYHVYWGLSE